MTFADGIPTAVAVQIGSGSFTTASIQSGKLSLTVPAGSTNYAIAYVCPPLPFVFTTTNEFVVEATVQDSTNYTLSCFGAPTLGSATGSVDATAIPGATSVVIGGRGLGTTLSSINTSFNVNMATGMNDVVALAFDGSNNLLAVKILRSQTIPGAVNGGSTIVFSTSDETTLEPVTVNNVPAAFIPPVQFVTYSTANGTSFGLGLSTAMQYRVVPAPAAQPGDAYFIDSGTDDTATHNSVVSVNQTFTSASPLTLNLPPVWSYSGPTPAAFATFTFNYAGFNVSPSLTYRGFISWQPTSTTENNITVNATASFQNGAATLSIPNLTSLPGFLAPAASGTSVFWAAYIFDGDQGSTFLPDVLTGSGPLVENRGNYTEP